MVIPLFIIAQGAVIKVYIKLSDPEREFMTVVVFGNESLLIWLNCCMVEQLKPVVTTSTTPNVSDFIGNIKAPAGMTWLTCGSHDNYRVVTVFWKAMLEVSARSSL